MCGGSVGSTVVRALKKESTSSDTNKEQYTRESADELKLRKRRSRQATILSGAKDALEGSIATQKTKLF